MTKFTIKTKLGDTEITYSDIEAETQKDAENFIKMEVLKMMKFENQTPEKKTNQTETKTEKSETKTKNNEGNEEEHEFIQAIKDALNSYDPIVVMSSAFLSSLEHIVRKEMNDFIKGKPDSEFELEAKMFGISIDAFKEKVKKDMIDVQMKMYIDNLWDTYKKVNDVDDTVIDYTVNQC